MADFVSFSGVPLAVDSTSEPAVLSSLSSYKTSKTAIRWFCGKCSTHILWQCLEPNPKWLVAGGTLERIDGIVKNTHHIFIDDTLDGGMADNLTNIDGIELSRYATSPDAGKILPLGWKDLSTDVSQAATSDRLHAYCHCKANAFYITRPSAASFVPFSPYPDVTHPYVSLPKEALDNTGDEKWWLRPLGSPNPTHYLGGHCACTSCRRSCGFTIQSWIFIPRNNILFSISSSDELVPLDLQNKDKRPPGLVNYKSSEGRNREFCGTCGATVFWWGTERPDLVDVSAGLVAESLGGVRAEGWVDWWKERVSFAEDALNVKLVKGLEEGLQASKKRV
ncbi:hypothetical protein H0H93_003159 [Arthromyces matolae]|nr:hypothetical protein H0H93_003159 [Arthromyces matolae]